MIDVDRLKQKYRIEDYIENDLGQTPRRTSKWVMFQCPWHHDTNPSLGVDIDNQTVKCFAGCPQTENSLDIIGYVQARNNCSFLEAVKILENGSSVPQHKSNGHKKRKKKPEPTLNTQALARMQTETHVSQAKTYFAGRGIAPYIVAQRGFTVDTEYAYVTRNYNMGCNGTSRRFKLVIPRYLIVGWKWGKQVIIETRRSDASVQKILEKYPAIADDIRSKTPGGAIDFDMVSPRYRKWPGSDTKHVYNAHILVTLDKNQKKKFVPLPYVLVTEGAIDALSLHSLGYAAVGTKYPPDGLFSRHINIVWVIQENDGGGVQIAKRVARTIGHSNVKILTLPDDFNDVNEMATIEPGMLRKHLAKYGITPVGREFLDEQFARANKYDTL